METLLNNPIRYAKETLAGLLKYAFGKGIVTLGVMGATLRHIRYVLSENLVTLGAFALFTAFVLLALFGHR